MEPYLEMSLALFLEMKYPALIWTSSLASIWTWSPASIWKWSPALFGNETRLYLEMKPGSNLEMVHGFYLDMEPASIWK